MDPQHKDEKDVVCYVAEPSKFGTGIRAVGEAISGAAISASHGPLGAVTGGGARRFLGAIAGTGIAEGIDPDTEKAYWQRRYRDEPC